MSLNTVNPHEMPKGVYDVAAELQRIKVSVVAGAAANTKMDIAALRTEDTILSVLSSTSGTFADDTANVTVQATKASGTITLTGAPVADETFVVNGVTYTFKSAPTDVRHVKIGATVTLTAASVAAAINSYENRRESGGNWRAPQVVATSAAGVVTVTAVVDGAAGNSITLTESATNTAVSGSGTLTNGTDTGGIKSSTNNTSKSMLIVWFDKNA